MGGLSSKTFKLHKADKKTPAGQKRSSVTGVQYRDKEFQLARETQSAYYYDNKHKEAKSPEPSGSAVDPQKRVVLRRAAGSDHMLFRRVRETPTAIYYIPNDDGDTDVDFDTEQEGDKKHIVLENPATIVEETIKVIRDGSSGIIIRSGGDLAKDVNDKETGVKENLTTVVANVIDENEEADHQKRESASKEGADHTDDQTEILSATTCNDQNKTLSETETATFDEQKDISTAEKDKTEQTSTTTEYASVPKTTEKTQENHDLSPDKVPLSISNGDMKEHQGPSEDTKEPPNEPSKSQSKKSDPNTADDAHEQQPVSKEHTDSEVKPIDRSADEPLPCDQLAAIMVTNTDLQGNGLASDEKTGLPDLKGDDEQIEHLETKHQVNEDHTALDRHFVPPNTVDGTNEEPSPPNGLASNAVTTDDPKSESKSREQITSLVGSDETKEKEQPLTDQMLSIVTKDHVLETEDTSKKCPEPKELDNQEDPNKSGNLPMNESEHTATAETADSKSAIGTIDAYTSDDNIKSNTDTDDSKANNGKGDNG